jgi:hypothetical protein
MPPFLVSDPAESTGLISTAMATDGSFNKNTPGMFVALLSRSLACLRKPVSLSSIVTITYA